jgi:sporulation protein YlmC with PRC-barrel domain
MCASERKLMAPKHKLEQPPTNPLRGFSEGADERQIQSAVSTELLLFFPHPQTTDIACTPDDHPILEITMSYEDRDTNGTYKTAPMQSTAFHADHNGPGPHLMGADTLIGNDVVNKSSEILGDIKEIMLDMRTGEVKYAVLAFGGFLGMGEKLFAVPWTALTLDTNNKCFVLDASKERLENAPGFDKDMWPDMADATWQQGIKDFYGANQHHSV